MNRAFVVASRFAGKQVAGSAAPNVTRPLSTVAANTIKIIFVDQEVRMEAKNAIEGGGSRKFFSIVSFVSY